MRIGLDFDGVIIDHSSHKVRLAADFGYIIEPWQTNTNVMKRFVPEPYYSNLSEIIYSFLTPKAPPIVGSLDYISKLDGELYIISARRRNNIRFAQEWLSLHHIYDLIPAERVFFCGNSNEKSDCCRQLKIDIILDDKLGVLDVLDTNVRKILFDDHGVSKRCEFQHGYETVSSWRDFFKILSR
jgi:5'(3')-deoxyribonucleotidase